MSGSSTSVLPILDDFIDTRDTVMVAFSGFTILVWDHIITLDDEIELIWKRDKGLLTYLFLLNRYLTPLGFIVNLVVQLSHFPAGGLKRLTFIHFFFITTNQAHSCRHFVRYEGAMTVIGIQVAGIIMFLRVRALYNRKKAIIWSVVLVFFVWLVVNALLLTYGEPVPHSSGVRSCTMIFDPSISNVASASAWLPLLYDTYVFALVLYKTICRTGHLVRTLLSDGILYYSVICAVNIVLTIMIVRAGPGIKNITAQLELLLTVAMVSRITLNLRRQALEGAIISLSSNAVPSRQRRTLCERSGSDGTTGAHSRENSAASTLPRRGSTGFRSKRVSYPEHIRLSPIYSVNVTPEASLTASPVGEEAPKLEQPQVNKGIGGAI